MNSGTWWFNSGRVLIFSVAWWKTQIMSSGTWWFNSGWMLIFSVEWWAKWANHELWGLFSAEWWTHWANNELWGLFSVEWWAYWANHELWGLVVRVPGCFLTWGGSIPGGRFFDTVVYFLCDFDVLTQNPSRKVREGPRSTQNPLQNNKITFCWFVVSTLMFWPRIHPGRSERASGAPQTI